MGSTILRYLGFVVPRRSTENPEDLSMIIILNIKKNDFRKLVFISMWVNCGDYNYYY